MEFGHSEGEQHYLGDLLTIWLLATYKSWDDPPSIDIFWELFLLWKTVVKLIPINGPRFNVDYKTYITTKKAP